MDDWTRESRDQLRQAQVETTSRNPDAAARLRASANQLTAKVRELRETHLQNAVPLIRDASADYELTNLRPGDADKAMSFKPDPAFPDVREPNRVQLITVTFAFSGDPKNTQRRDWGQRTKDTFDFAALAALVK